MRKKRARTIKIFFTGGGTGGHVFPGVAVVQQLISSSFVDAKNILWIGSGKGIEREITSRFDIPYKSISSGKLRRYFSFLNFIDIFKIILGFLQSFIFLSFHRPSLIFSKGGYVSVPPSVAGKILGIPVISHESDITPGLATKINSRFAKIILTSYNETALYLRSGIQVHCVGNPVRNEVKNGVRERGRSFASVPKGYKVVLVLGGSLGAKSLNELVDKARTVLNGDYFFIHQTGDNQGEKKMTNNCYKSSFFSAEFPDLLAAADLVVSRAGAGTLWENAVVKKPAILIPLGKGASRGDQIINAQYFEKIGAAKVLYEDQSDFNDLARMISSTLNDQNLLDSMKNSLEKFIDGDSAQKIERIIKEELK